MLASFESSRAAPTVGSSVAKTYALLSATLVMTAAAAVYGANSTVAWQHPLILMIAGFACLLAVMFLGMRESPVALPLVFAFSALQGMVLGPLLEVYAHMPNGMGPLTIIEATSTTAIVFAALTLYAAISKRNFSFMASFLFVGLILVVIASFANIFLHIPALSLVIAGVSAMVFSGYILVDTSNMLRAGQTNPVLMVVALYLDILNLFLALLRPFAAFNSRD
jgi:modulator of FtsH protease